jgi:hypothetical protein
MLIHRGNSRYQLIAWTCPACGARARVPSTTPRVYCYCGFKQLHGPTPGLGDLIAALLCRLGITQSRYTRLKRRVGLKPKCGCGRRQRQLNALGRKLGLTG